MFPRLFYIWLDYRLHHIAEVITRCTLGLLIVTVPAVPVVIAHPPIHHKPAPSPTVSVSKPKPVVKSSTPKKVAVSTPPPASNTPAVTAPAPAPAEQPKPVPATQPSPGSGAKKLAPAPTQPINSTPPSGSDSSSTPSTTGDTSTPPTSPSSQTPNYATGGYTSTNWSGYVATAGNYKGVSASWIVPSATGNGTSETADSTWIGIGGVFSGDLIQTGTMNSVSASGQLTSAAFFELLPDPALEITSMKVIPGDSMSASINEVSTGQWTITITDATSGKTFTTTVNYTSNYSSAEWIEEDPSYIDGSLVPFDNFSPANFTNGKVTVAGSPSTISAANSSPITLVDRAGKPLARPTVLTLDGSGFTVYRQ